MISTKKYIIPIIITFILAGLASSNTWLDRDTSTGLPESGFYSPSFKPTNQTAIEIIKSPIFRYIGEEASLGTGVNATAPASSQKITNVSTSNATTYVILGNSTNSTAQMGLDFSGAVERNLKYAENSSTIKVGKNGKWVPMSLPWLVS